MESKAHVEELRVQIRGEGMQTTITANATCTRRVIFWFQINECVVASGYQHTIHTCKDPYNARICGKNRQIIPCVAKIEPFRNKSLCSREYTL